MPAPRFGADARPPEILDSFGRWYAAELGWRWVKSRHDLEFRDGPRVLRFNLQCSTWSRAEVATRVSTRIMVLDDDLKEWWRANSSTTGSCRYLACSGRRNCSHAPCQTPG